MAKIYKYSERVAFLTILQRSAVRTIFTHKGLTVVC